MAAVQQHQRRAVAEAAPAHAQAVVQGIVMNRQRIGARKQPMRLGIGHGVESVEV
jgi:hypothetical protein